MSDDAVTADPSDPDSANADSQTTGLMINVAIGVPVTLLCLFLFDPLRRKMPDVYETRRVLHNDRDPLDYNGNRVATPPAPSYRTLGWLRPTLRLDLDTIADTHGLDAALFLRFHRFMLALFCALSVPSLFLLPTYWTGSNKDLGLNDEARTVGINRFSISNIQRDNNWRFWFILFFEYAIAVFVCYHIYVHLSLYCRDRRRYRASRHPANYAILVQDIPKEARSADAVGEYWEKVFPGLIAHVYYVADARRLESWKERFWHAVDKRESAEWRLNEVQQKQARRAERRREKKAGLRRRRVRDKNKKLRDDENEVAATATAVSVVPNTRTSRASLNDSGSAEVVIPPTPSADPSNPAHSQRDYIPPTPSADPSHPANVGVTHPDIIPPTPSASQQDIVAAAATAAAAAADRSRDRDPNATDSEPHAMPYPSTEAAVAAGALPGQGRELAPTPPPPGKSELRESIDEAEYTIKTGAGAVTPATSSRVIDDDADDKEADKHFKGGLCGVRLKRGPPRKPEAAVEYWELAQRKAWARVVAHQRMRDEGQFPVTNSAIVVFNSRRAASVAAQTNFARKENEWRVSRAPEPNAIDWSALCVSGWTIYVRQFITTALSVGLTLFWIIPVTLIMTVVNLDAMIDLKLGGSQPFQFLSGLRDLSPLMVGFIESWLPTVVLTLFLMFVPNLFELFVSISRITSLAERDRLVRDWYFLFTMFSNFLFVAFAGTLLQELQKILDKPADTVQILARNIPKQAAFMMNFIVLTALTEAPRELLQLGRIFFRWMHLKYTAKTKRQRDESNIGDMAMDYVGFYSLSQLVVLLGLVYCTIQTFIIFCCIGYFAVTYVVFKYNLCFSLYNEYEDGGRMYGGALYSVWAGQFAHMLTMVGVFGLNKSLAQSVLIIIPTVATALFLMHCRRSFDRVVEHGSALETQDRIDMLEGGGMDDIEEDLVGTYEHPGFENLPEYDEIENMNGLGDSADEREDMLDVERKAAEKAWALEKTNADNGDSAETDKYSSEVPVSTDKSTLDKRSSTKVSSSYDIEEGVAHSAAVEAGVTADVGNDGSSEGTSEFQSVQGDDDGIMPNGQAAAGEEDTDSITRR